MTRRVGVVDALRGFALFGVVVSNVAVIWGAGLTAESTLDRWVGIVESYVVTGRFMSLFSLLFGISFGLYLHNASQTGTFNAARYLRRLAILFVIGVVNRILLGPDILMTYAVFGVILLGLRHASDRTLAVAIVLAVVAPACVQAGLDGVGYRPGPPIVPRAERLRLAVEGEYIALVRVRALMMAGWWRELITNNLAYLSLFLFGLLVTRRHLFSEPSRQRRQLRYGLLAAAAITLAGFAAQSVLRPLSRGGSSLIRESFGVAWELTVFAQAVAYSAAFGLLWMTGAQRVLQGLAPAGRMPLTNYIGASLVATLLVLATHSFGRLSVTAASAAGVLIWCLSLWWSAVWFRRHSIGPLEWLWRRLSTGAALSRAR